jgi:hypothetical protein
MTGKCDFAPPIPTTGALPHARQDPTTGPNAGRVHAELSRLQLTDRLAPRRARELSSAKLSGQAGRALSAQAACTADTNRHWRCSGGAGNTWSAVRDESWSPWSERAPVRSVAVVVVVIGEPLTVVGLESVGGAIDEAPGATRLRKRVALGAPAETGLRQSDAVHNLG